MFHSNYPNKTTLKVHGSIFLHARKLHPYLNLTRCPFLTWKLLLAHFTIILPQILSLYQCHAHFEITTPNSNIRCLTVPTLWVTLCQCSLTYNTLCIQNCLFLCHSHAQFIPLSLPCAVVFYNPGWLQTELFLCTVSTLPQYKQCAHSQQNFQMCILPPSSIWLFLSICAFHSNFWRRPGQLLRK